MPRHATDQPGLWDLPETRPATPTRPRHPRIHAPAPRRTKEQRERLCDPTCMICGKPEGRGLCHPRCAVLCTHVAEPSRADVCITTTHVVARLVIGLPGAQPGRRLAVVECPHCERLHWHTPAYGVHWRLAQCGQPYIVHLARPAVAPLADEHTPDQQQAARRGAQLARDLLATTNGTT